ncbi:MAG: Hsp20/alpha crystallin family protein [Methanosphaera sp.]|nr:Hsp20/alpha crystallin family protein [Methanosphaera sp.]
MSNVYVDSKEDHKKEEEAAEEVVDVKEETEAKETCECGAETEEECVCGDDAEEEASEDKKDFDYKVYGKETVEETKNMAEKMLNDVVATLKSKQSDWNQIIDEYKSKKPSVDVLDYEDDLVVKVDLPRVTKDAINIQMSNESIEIEVEFPDEYESEENVKILRRERCSGKTKNLIVLPVEVDIQEVNATFEDYVLTITLPKIKGKKVDVEIL